MAETGQLELPQVAAGGARRRSRVPHRPRPTHKKAHPLHVTIKALPNLPSFRQQRVHALVLLVLRNQRKRAYAETFRILHFSIQSNHIHLILEAEQGPTEEPSTRHLNAIRSGVSGFMIAFAQRLNRMFERSGRVWADRYHRRDLKTPTETKNALRYVFANARRHGVTLPGSGSCDPFSSAKHFDGFSKPLPDRYDEPDRWPILRPQTWLLDKGWKKQGLIDPWEMPRAHD